MIFSSSAVVTVTSVHPQELCLGVSVFDRPSLSLITSDGPVRVEMWEVV